MVAQAYSRRAEERDVVGWPSQRLWRALQIHEAAAGPARRQADAKPGDVTAADAADAAARPAPGEPHTARGSGADSSPGPAGHPSLDSEWSRVEERLLKLINVERAKADLPPLEASAALHQVARRRAADLARGEATTWTDGTAFYDLLGSAGIRFQWAGESLLRNGCSDRWSVVLAAADLMGNARHRENVLAEFFRHAGVGMAAASDGTKYFAVIFTD